MSKPHQKKVSILFHIHMAIIVTHNPPFCIKSLILFAVKLSFTQVGFATPQQGGSDEVSATTALHIDMTKLGSGDWYPNQCFEMTFRADYKDMDAIADYSSFLPSLPPQCTPLETFGIDCKVKDQTTHTLQFFLKDLTPAAVRSKSIDFLVTNFQNPFSRVLVYPTLVWYSDQACTQDRSEIDASRLNLRVTNIDPDTTSLTSTSDTVGTNGLENAFKLAFTPGSPIAPNKKGSIDIRMPDWYNIDNGQKTGQMFSELSVNTCESDVIKIVESKFAVDNLRIKFDGIIEPNTRSSRITLTCKGFRNPIYPDLWTGFGVSLYDQMSVGANHQISYSDKIVFDATKLKPWVLPPKNFNIEVGNPVVRAYSEWIFNLAVNVPLEKDCYIKVMLPNDLNYKHQDINVHATKIFQTGRRQIELLPNEFCDSSKIDSENCRQYPQPDPTKPVQDDRTYWIFHGCQNSDSLGAAPSGRLIYADFQMPRAIKRSEPFNIEIYKDKALKQLVVQMTEGVSIDVAEIDPGAFTGLVIKPKNEMIQTVTDFQISLTTAHKLEQPAKLIVIFPDSLTLPTNGDNTVLMVTDQGNMTITGVISGQNMTFNDFLKQYQGEIQENLPLTLIVPGIKTQQSTKDSGNFTVSTEMKIGDQYYVVDSVTVNNTYQAKAAPLEIVEPIQVPNSKTWGKGSTYKIYFKNKAEIPINSYVLINVPEPMKLTDETLTAADCGSEKCERYNETAFIVHLTKEYYPDETIEVDFGGMRNPRSTKPTGRWAVAILDPEKAGNIGVGYMGRAEVTEAGSITEVAITSSSNLTGESSIYQVNITNKIPIATGDRVYFTFPPQVNPPSDGKAMACKPGQNIEAVECQINGREAVALMTKVPFLEEGGSYSFTVDAVLNPYSTQKSDDFTNIHYQTHDFYPVAKSDVPADGIHSTEPHPFVVYNTSQSNQAYGQTSDLILSFETFNALPLNGAVVLTYPRQITLVNKDNSNCIIQSYATFQNEKYCTIKSDTNQIFLQNIFGQDTDKYFGNVTITLQDVINPIKNHPLDPFTITSYTDQSLTYKVDTLPVDTLYLGLECVYPCDTCLVSDRNFCSTCWMNDLTQDPTFMMNYNSTATCKFECDFDFSANLTVRQDHVCSKCHDSCIGCFPSSTHDCKKCNRPEFQYQVEGTQNCVRECSEGQFIKDVETCDHCAAPCMDCEGTATNCTLCDTTSQFPALLQNKCLEKCPDGYADVNGVCKRCERPCKECLGAIDQCTECDGSRDRNILFNETCWDTCPHGTCPKMYDEPLKQDQCLACQTSGCLLCDCANLTNCLICDVGLYILNGTCMSVCPTNYVATDDTIGCRYWQLADLGMVYFPFLITATMFAFIVLFGIFKKKKVLVKGEVQRVSYQSSITAYLAFLAPLQMLAAFAQGIFWSWSNNTAQTILTFIAVGIIVVLNVIFAIKFHQKFREYKLKPKAQELVDKGKLTKDEAKKDYKNLELQDARFEAWYKRHVFTYWAVWAFSIVFFWRVSKILYSRFYSMGNFTAYWSKAKVYRDLIRFYGLVSMIAVDLYILIISIVGLAMSSWGNQLYITMIESCVLAIVTIILTSIEIYKKLDPGYLQYTWKHEKTGRWRVNASYDNLNQDDSGILDNLERDKTMRKLLGKVKGDKLQQNNLEELIDQFGSRKCHSATVGFTGWEKESDPRKVATYSTTSPGGEKKSRRAPVKFTKADMPLDQPDNCYFDSVFKEKGEDMAVQGDPYNETTLSMAQSRNQANLFTSKSRESSSEEGHISRNKKRGRDKKDDEEDSEERAIRESAEEKERKRREEDLRLQQEEDELFKRMLEEQQAKNGGASDELMREIEEATAKRMAAEKEKAIADALALEKEQQAKEAAEQAEKDRILKEQREKEIKDRQEAAERERKEAAAKADQEALERQKELERLQKEVEDAEVRRQQADKLAADHAQKVDEEKIVADSEQVEKEKVLKELEDQRKKTGAAPINLDLMDDGLRKIAEEQQKEKERLAQLAKEQVEKDAKLANMNDRVQKLRDELAAAQKAEQERLAAERERLLREAGDQAELDRLAAQAARDREAAEAAERARKKALMDAEAERLAREALDAEDARKARERLEAELAKQPKLIEFIPKSDPIIEVPPRADHRLFNENDILGDLDRDEHGIFAHLPEDPQHHDFVDKKGKRINPKGYLIHGPCNDVLDNYHGRVAFPHKSIDPKTGEIPQPFSWERYNFNPHNIIGDFDRKTPLGKDNGVGEPILKPTSKGILVDKRGRRVNKHGWLEADDQIPIPGRPLPKNNIIDKHGRKKLDKTQLDDDGDIPKLFNLKGKKYDIRDVMGKFDRDPTDNIIMIQTEDGDLIDKENRTVNERGYLVDPKGNIIDNKHNQIFPQSCLLNGEFPKIFPFTKLNLKKLFGDFDKDLITQKPILEHDPDTGVKKDKQGRPCNGNGYLIDPIDGSIIDDKGNLVFNPGHLEKGEQEVPEVFRCGVLGIHSESDMISQIDNEPVMDREVQESQTTFDSKMDDTPLNYNEENQRVDTIDADSFPEDEEERQPTPQSELPQPIDLPITKKPKRKKKKPNATIEFLEPTKREIVMADAYGGKPKGHLRRPGIKYEEDRLRNSKKFVVSKDQEQVVRAELERLAKSVSGFDKPTRAPLKQNMMSSQNLMNYDSEGTKKSSSRSPLGRNPQNLTQSQEKKKGPQDKKKGSKPDMKNDFQKVFGKPLDQFLNESEWDDKSQQSSRRAPSARSQAKVMTLEKQFLGKHGYNNPSQQQLNPSNSTLISPLKPKTERENMLRSQPDLSKVNKKPKKMLPAPGPPRETIISYTDDPGVIHRGEILPFHIKKKNEGSKPGAALGESSIGKGHNKSLDGSRDNSPGRYN